MKTLRLFLDVARLRSVSRAAKLHGITQSAVSQRIRQLESKLGVTLLDRSVRPLGLTPAGEVFAEEAGELVERYEQLTRRIGRLQETPSGEVRVAAIYSAGIDLMQSLREDFESDNPEVRVKLDYRRPEGVDRAVREGTCDFGIVSYPRTWPGLVVRRLRDERMSVVCKPDHPVLKRRSVRASTLGRYSMLGLDPELPVSKHIRKYLRGQGVEPSFTYEPDNIDTIKSMLAVGDDLAILPRRTVAREVAAGTLGVVDLEPELNRPMGIIHRRRPSLGQTARTFLDYLLEHADPDAPLEVEERRVSLAS